MGVIVVQLLAKHKEAGPKAIMASIRFSVWLADWLFVSCIAYASKITTHHYWHHDWNDKLFMKHYFLYKNTFFLQVLSGCAVIVRGQPRGGPPPERQINLSNVRAGALARRAVQGQPDSKDTPDEVNINPAQSCSLWPLNYFIFNMLIQSIFLI